MNAVAVAMEHVCKELGVRFRYNTPVRRILVERGRASGVETSKGIITADAVVSNADYVHTELSLLEPQYRSYSASYWSKRTMAPSGFILYLGVKKRLTKLKHHNLFFANDWQVHFDQIFGKKPDWPEKPSYYVCAPSKNDPNVAPKGCENLFVLVPVAAGLDDDERTRDEYADKIIDHLEAIAGESFADAIVVKKIFSQRDFVERYNSYKGTALGLAHTLFQTALWRPSPTSKKVPGLFYAGQYTHPGVGVPMCVISGEMASYFVDRELKGKPRPL
jgi:phytoene desaturase